MELCFIGLSHQTFFLLPHICLASPAGTMNDIKLSSKNCEKIMVGPESHDLGLEEISVIFSSRKLETTCSVCYSNINWQKNGGLSRSTNRRRMLVIFRCRYVDVNYRLITTSFYNKNNKFHIDTSAKAPIA